MRLSPVGARDAFAGRRARRAPGTPPARRRRRGHPPPDGAAAAHAGLRSAAAPEIAARGVMEPITD